jgi:hypothetical protein
MRKNLIEVEREQLADCARIDAAVRLAEQEFANLYRRDYGPEEMRRKWISVRDRTILAIRDVRHNIAQRAREASRARARLMEKSALASVLSLVDDTGAADKALPQFATIGARNDLERLARIARWAEELDARYTRWLCAQSIAERPDAAASKRLAPGIVPEDREDFSSASIVASHDEVEARTAIFEWRGQA